MTKGYNTYRGRGSGKRIAAVIALVLVIVGAVGYLVVQNYIVYDDAGQSHLELPQRQKPQKKTQPDLADEDVTIEYVEPPEKWLPVQELHAVQLLDGMLKVDPKAILQSGNEAMVINMKRINGSIPYATEADVPTQVEVERLAETRANLKTLLADDSYAVAHLHSLCDSYFVRAYPEASHLIADGTYWYDGDGWTWLDPTNPNVLGYITALCKEYAALGFDEILLDSFAYPTSGWTKSMVIDPNLDRVAILQSFAESLRKSLPADMVLSVMIRGEVTPETGLSAEMIADCFDRVYLAPGMDAAALLAALPEEFDRDTRVVQMGYQAAEKGSYVLLMQPAATEETEE